MEPAAPSKYHLLTSKCIPTVFQSKYPVTLKRRMWSSSPTIYSELCSECVDYLETLYVRMWSSSPTICSELCSECVD